MIQISGAQITFAKADLAHFNDGQKQVFYVFGHILNHTKLIEAQVFSHWSTAVDLRHSPIERDAALFGVLEFLILLAGDLYEGWRAVHSCYYGTQLSKTLNSQLPAEVQEILKKLPDHFTGKSITSRLRNDFSYHHSPEKILSTFEILDDDDSHTAYLFEGENNYFDYATKIRIAAVAKSVGLSDCRKLIEHLVATVVGTVFRDFSTVLNAILVALFETIPHHREPVELPSVPSMEELSARYFFYVLPSAA